MDPFVSILDGDDSQCHPKLDEMLLRTGVVAVRNLETPLEFLLRQIHAHHPPAPSSGVRRVDAQFRSGFATEVDSIRSSTKWHSDTAFSASPAASPRWGASTYPGGYDRVLRCGRCRR